MVLIEGISVVIRAAAVLNVWEEFDDFKTIVPNRTLVADDELVRVGFMSPVDTERFVHALERYGLTYVRDGKAVDLVVVDQQRGPAAPCDWLDFGDVTLTEGRRVAAARLAGGIQTQFVTPEGWRYEGSLSERFGYVSSDALHTVQIEPTGDGLARVRTPLSSDPMWTTWSDDDY